DPPRLFTDTAALGNHLLQFLHALLDLLDVGEQVVHLQAVDLWQGDLLEPGDARLGRELLGGHPPLQVVPPQDVPDSVDQARPGLPASLRSVVSRRFSWSVLLAMSTWRRPRTGLPCSRRSRLTHSSSLSEAASRRSVLHFLRWSGWMRITL